MDSHGLNEKNVEAHEWIGERVTVQSVRGKPMQWNGTIAWETQKTIELDTGKGLKKIPKGAARIVFSVGGKKAVVEGKDWMFRPEERIKKWWRKSH